jgi:hypothetical protein
VDTVSGSFAAGSCRTRYIFCARAKVSQDFDEAGEWVEPEPDLCLFDECVKRAGVTGAGEVDESQEVEEDLCALRIKAAAENAGDDFGDGALDGVAIVEGGQVKGGQPGFSSARATRAASWVVEVAELFAAQGRWSRRDCRWSGDACRGRN